MRPEPHDRRTHSRGEFEPGTFDRRGGRRGCPIVPAGTRGAVAGSQQVFRVNTDRAVPGT
jgi:hypothetical protein